MKSAPEAETQHEGSYTFYLSQRKVLQNLLVMTYIWCLTIYGYEFLQFYLKYLPGSIYANSIIGSVADMMGNLSGGLLISKFGFRKSYQISLLAMVLGGTLILIFGEKHASWMPLFVMFAKFGESGLWTNSYTVTVQIFPAAFRVRAMGLMYFIATVASAIGPIVAELG